MASTLDAAAGRWPQLLADLGGLTAQQLTDRHQPCPACGGKDRYRWDSDDGGGSWFCNRCGGKDHQGGGGSGVDLLMRLRSWSLPEALRAVEQHLGLVQRPEPPTAGAEHFWRYSPDFIVCRFPGKKIRPLWWDGNAWVWKQCPAPRPLYWARLRPHAPVLVVEGEKTADAAARLFPTYAVVTWPGGCKAINRVNWKPLAGRTVLLWPDNDDPGRQAMQAIATALQRDGATVSIINLPPDAQPQGWDLADATDWSPADAAAALERLTQPLTAAEPPEPPQAASAPFQCLGFDDGGYFYQPSNTGQVMRLSRASHTGTNLVALATLAYWDSLFPGKSGPNWAAAASWLFEQQAAVGVYCPDRIRGRGAWWDEHRPVLHLGDRLLVEGKQHPITTPPASRYHYQRLAAIDLPTGLQPLTDQEGAELVDLACRFHWEVPASGLLLAGWAALAPICGALSWRPHVWLTASAGSGKSALLDRFLGTLLQALALWPEGSTSEASIRQELRADALPVIMDEAESNEQADKKRIQDILALARVASSSGRGFVGRGGADGQAQRFTVRSMFFLCSISTALKQGADSSRFAQLTLRNPSFLPKAERIAHWAALDRDLSALVTPELGHRLLLRSVRLIPVIRDSVAIFRRAAADRFDSQRQGDQYGTLLAGAWALVNDRVPTEAEALAMIDSNDWSHYREAQEQPDEQRCLQQILQHQLRVEGDRGATYQRTVWELCELASSTTTSVDIGITTAEAHLGRVGIRVDNDRLLISNTAQGLRRILADTPWAHSWSTVLNRLEGAQKAGVTRFKGLAGVSRAISLPLIW